MRSFAKIKKAEDFSSASFRLVPSPRYLPTLNLLQRGFGSSACGERSSAVAHHSVGNRAEGTVTGLVRSDWLRPCGVAAGRAGARGGRTERIAALGARSQSRVDQASA